jgi:hypothetical protein
MTSGVAVIIHVARARGVTAAQPTAARASAEVAVIARTIVVDREAARPVADGAAIRRQAPAASPQK